jgi:hypothetical protein
MRNFILCLVLSLLFPSLASANSEYKECKRNCVEFSYTDNGYDITVLGNAADVVYNQSVRFNKPVPKNIPGEKQIIHLSRDKNEILPANTTTTTTSTPIDGGGSIVVVTVRVNGVIISQTVIIVDAEGRVRRTVDTL